MWATDWWGQWWSSVWWSAVGAQGGVPTWPVGRAVGRYGPATAVGATGTARVMGVWVAKETIP